MQKAQELQLNNKSNAQAIIKALNNYIKRADKKKLNEAIRVFEEAYGRN